MTASELLVEAKRIEQDLLRKGNPHDGRDYAVMQLARAVLLFTRPDSRLYQTTIAHDRQCADRYEWLRGDGLEYVKWEGLTSDTCDVGLDHAIDCRLAAGSDAGHGKPILD